MLDFIATHYLFVLTILGAVLSFVASFTTLVAAHKPVRFLAVVLSVGLVIGVAYQLFSYVEQQEAARARAEQVLIEKAAQSTRDEIMKEIHFDVRSIASRLRDKSLEVVGTRLVSVTTQAGFEESVAFAKGSPEMWALFAGWLQTLPTDMAPSLSLTFGANHRYNSGLLLAYLLTSERTLDVVSEVVDTHSQWESFDAANLYVQAFSENIAHVRWVLFYQQDKLIAFANAKDFARELSVYHRAGEDGRISGILNRRTPLAALLAEFPSIATAVYETISPERLVAEMIEQELPISVATEQQVPYVARLEKMIRIAAGGE